MRCRSKKLIRERISAGEGLLERMLSIEICQVVSIVFEAPPSCRKSPVSRRKSHAFLRSLSRDLVRYFGTEIPGHSACI